MHFKRLTVPAIALCLGAMAGCTTPESGAMDYDAAAGIGAANAIFMARMAEGDAAGVAALYTSDGTIMPPGAPMSEGTAAITESLGADFADGGIDLTLTTTEIHGTGETVTEVGNYTVATLDGMHVDHGDFVVVWRYVNGEWKLHRDIWNSNMAAVDDDDDDHGDDDD